MIHVEMRPLTQVNALGLSGELGMQRLIIIYIVRVRARVALMFRRRTPPPPAALGLLLLVSHQGKGSHVGRTF